MKTSLGNQRATQERGGRFGPGLIEFAISATGLLTLVFGVIDFGRAIYDVEVMKNLTGEGYRSMATRKHPVGCGYRGGGQLRILWISMTMAASSLPQSTTITIPFRSPARRRRAESRRPAK